MAATAAKPAPAAKTAAPAMTPAAPATKQAEPAPKTTAPKAPVAAPAKLPVAAEAVTAEKKLMDEVRIGFEELRKLNHDELRTVIARRVELLENVLKDREERRAAIETAKMAGKLLDLRHERAVRIHKTVNTGSYWAAAATTLLLFVVMI
jgi:hypothetical protein